MAEVVQTYNQGDLEAVKARMGAKMLNMTERMLDSMEILQHRLDGIDDALAKKINLDEATPKEIYDLFNQTKESFKVRQEFLKTLSGYGVDTSNVKVEEAETVEATVISEEDAERVKAEIMSRSLPSSGQ